jgi:hypothetical protein
MIRAVLRGIKFLLMACVTVVVIGVCIGAVYVGSILIGAALIIVLLYVLIREYHREDTEEKGP